MPRRKLPLVINACPGVVAALLLTAAGGLSGGRGLACRLSGAPAGARSLAAQASGAGACGLLPANFWLPLRGARAASRLPYRGTPPLAQSLRARPSSTARGTCPAAQVSGAHASGLAQRPGTWAFAPE